MTATPNRDVALDRAGMTGFRELTFLAAGPASERKRSTACGVSMRHPRRLVWLIAGVAVAASVPLAFFGLWWAASAGSSQGSPELAAEWQAELSQYQSPDEAQTKDPKVIVVRFSDGSWVFGRCQSSHGVWKRGGGTVVVKDSKGQVRAFFGHVCGDENLGAVWEHWNLDLYYWKTLDPAEGGFVEYHFR